MVLYRPDGEQMQAQDWQNPIAKTLAVALDGRLISDSEGDVNRDRLLLLINAHDEPVEFTVPTGRGTWRVVLTTDDPDPIDPLAAGERVAVRDRSLLLLHSD